MLWVLVLAGLVALFLVRGSGRRLPAHVQVVAHRGASAFAPENTLAALRLASDLGAEWAEVDVQRTSDGVLVLVHDDSWKRTAGLDAAIRDTPWETVRKLDAGSWRAPEFAGEHPPRLDEVLEQLGRRLCFNLEVKSPENHPGLGPEVAAAVHRQGLARRVLLTSFDADLVEALAESEPDLEVGYLSARPIDRKHPRVRTYSLLHELVLADPSIVAEAHGRGCRVYVWTVDEPRIARRLARIGVDGIITNRPERMLSRLRWRF
jgi:glycerophosphoryl diester phosphodiesterase